MSLQINPITRTSELNVLFNVFNGILYKVDPDLGLQKNRGGTFWPKNTYMTLLVPNLGIFIFSRNFTFRQIREC